MTSNISNEQWKPIPGFESLYGVSNLGRIKSFARYVKRGDYTRPESIRSLSLDSKGYLRVSANVDGKNVGSIYVHQAVAKAFIGPYPSTQHEVRHLDGDSANNTLSNLIYGTKAENMADAIKHGTFSAGAKKLTRKDIIFIFEDTVNSISELCDKFGVSESSIKRVRNRKAWSDITKDLVRPNRNTRCRVFTKEEKELILNEIFTTQEIANRLKCSQQKIQRFRKAARRAIGEI